jgi:hypothetical protein
MWHVFEEPDRGWNALLLDENRDAVATLGRWYVTESEARTAALVAWPESAEEIE